MKAAIGILVALILWAGAGVAQASGELVTVETSYQEVTLTGFTRARATLRLVAEEAGRFAFVNAEVGDVISEGRHFGCLDTTYVDLDITANHARQERLRADVDYYTRQAERLGKLVDKNTTAQAELDDMVRRRAGAKAELAEIRARLRELTERKRRHCITVPAGWTVTERRVEPGQWVAAGEPVGQAGDFTGLLVPFALSHEEVKALRAQQDDLQVELLDEQRLVPAQAVHWNPAFDEQTRKTAVDLALKEGIAERRGGLRVALTLRLPDPSGALLAPREALAERFGQFWVLGTNGRELPVVYLGDLESDSKVFARIISDGLAAGDRIRLR